MLIFFLDSGPVDKTKEPALDFKLVDAYKQNSKNRKRIISDGDDEVDTVEIINTKQNNFNQDRIEDGGLFNNIKYQEYSSSSSS